MEVLFDMSGRTFVYICLFFSCFNDFILLKKTILSQYFLKRRLLPKLPKMRSIYENASF